MGATNESYRLNLEQGRFMASLESQICSELNVCGIMDDLGLWELEVSMDILNVRTYGKEKVLLS